MLNDFLGTLTTVEGKQNALIGVFKTFTPEELDTLLGKVQSGENEGKPRSAYAIRNGGSEPVSVAAGDNVFEYRLAVQRAKSRVGAFDVIELKRTHTVAMAEKLVDGGTFDTIAEALAALNATI